MRYPDCIREDGNCELCAQSSRWKDCKGNPAGELAYRRSVNNLTQQQVADAAGIHLTAYQRLEYGGRELGRASAQTVLGIARALNTTVENLLK